ncbi:hypothetical protein PH558_18515 [Rhizobium sp. CNPSo 4039]|nr:hypothetical protein [Rhizobium sp. CNPSo 4039]
MKILKIENGNGFFRVEESSEWQQIDVIDKNGLLKLLDLFLGKDVEMDSPEDFPISNQAHSIIYRSIHEKLSSLVDDKKRFKDESERMYLEEIKKYSNL